MSPSQRPAPFLRSRTLPSIIVPATAVVAMATASAAVGAMAAAAVDNGLTVPPSGNRSQSSSDSSPNEWQDIRDLLSLSSITGSKPLGSGSSDPGTPSSSVGGVRNKRSSADNSSPGNSNRLPKLFLNSSQGTAADGVKSNQQLQPPGNVMKTSPVQIQLQLLAGNNNDIHQPTTRPRRHSLESNDSLRGKALGTDNQQAPDVLPTTSGATTAGTRVNLAVPELQGKGFPTSPSVSGKRKTSHDRKKDSSLELLVHGLHLTKTDLKKMEKLTKINIHLHALFAAVEFGQVEKARAILEDNEVDINSYNSDGLSLMDVAVLTNNTEMVKLLIQQGAREGTEYGSKESLNLHLAQLLNEAEKQLEEKSQPSSSSPVRIDLDKHIALWKRRVRILRKMKSGLEQLKVPNSPNQARVEVVGEHSVHIWWLQPEADSGGICTKFKVQWSTHPDFAFPGGELEVRDTQIWKRGGVGDEFNEVNVTVSTCPSNSRCYFRVAAGNLSGYGSFKTTLPSSVLLSVWRIIDGRKPRFAGRLPILDDLFSKVRTWRPDYASEIRQLEDGLGEAPMKQRKNPAKINLRQFFGANVKFQKHLRRGVYFACIVFHEDKVLVTTEEFPPVVEVDDTYPASVNNDFHWLMKIGCTWSDVKTLRQDMERSSSSANAHFRIKILQAAAQLQSALGLQDLGQLHYQPLKDSQGTMVISSTCHLANIKAVPSSLNFKWLPLSKLQRRVVTNEESTASDLLLASLQEQINFMQVSNKPLPRGLYLGYLKMKSSVDLIRVLVPKDAPNLLPHAKIRDNPWVSSEEWQWIKKLAKNQPQNKNGSAEMNDGGDEGGDDKTDYSVMDGLTGKLNLQPSTAQLLFQSQLQRAACKLLGSMGIEGSVMQHRIYEDEVIELSPDVSVILLLPPPDSVCAVAGQSEALFHRPEFLSVPLQVFEMIHLRTYQRDLIGRYSRLSSILELDSNLAQLAMREAFSSVELAEAKQRFQRLQDVQVQVDSTWRGSRWIMDVLSLARDRTMTGVGVAIAALSQQIPPTIPVLSTPTEPAEESARRPALTLKTSNSSTRTNHSIAANNDGRIMGGIPGGKHRVLVKTKSDNKLLGNRNSMGDSPAFIRINTVRSRTPVCPECSVPLDLPGYVSNCGSCSCSRARYTQPETGELFKQQHSRSNETLPTPPILIAQNGARKCISRSENQLNNLEFQPFLDAEGTDDSTAVYAAAGQEDQEQQPEPKCEESCDEPPAPPPTKLQRGGSGGKKGRSTGSMRSNSQESECSHPSRSSHTPSLTSLSSVDGDPDSGSIRSGDVESGEASASGIIQVYAAYESGLANGTSVKLHVTTRTVAREVVDLVVRQLNMAVGLKGKGGPVYAADEFKNFCLVAVIGARERCLRDDFRPLHLQNPWKKGRLYVRQKKDVLAAIEQSGRQQKPQPAAL
ncbi:uncharacterized protein LOC116919246 isoform X4 [Daphnia magna]|nr:uncharacterized protein LOC116919246 isoform X4 [Daphnia magna]XP_045027300.1 uncharacterized protein LOC116919246 isoform X4 [Daphnia magna]